MSHQLLNHFDVIIIRFEQGRTCVPEGMETNPLGDSRAFCGWLWGNGPAGHFALDLLTGETQSPASALRAVDNPNWVSALSPAFSCAAWCSRCGCCATFSIHVLSRPGLPLPIFSPMARKYEARSGLKKTQHRQWKTEGKGRGVPSALLVLAHGCVPSG